LTWILRERWLWIIIVAVILIITLPLTVIWLILNLPPTARLIVTIVIIMGWGVAAGYRDWLVARRKEKEKER
jgi:uncharacterized membrane protein